MIHYLYVGRFERDGTTVRFERVAPDGPFRPRVQRPLTKADVSRLVQQATDGEHSEIPGEWTCWLADEGYVIGDRDPTSEAEIAFIVALVQQEGCELFEPLREVMPLAEWLESVQAVPAR